MEFKNDRATVSHRRCRALTSPATDVSVFRPERVDIRPEKVLRVHGYKNPESVRGDIRAVATEYAALAEKLLKVEVHFRRVAVAQCLSEALVLADGRRFESEIFERYLIGCSEIAVFVLTTGEALDETVRRHIDTYNLVEALFLESAGWLAIEQATRLFSAHLRAVLAMEGRKLAMRLGPGYVYKIGGRPVTWPLEQQRELFGLFDGHHLPVRLLESCAMMPKLSRSGLYGVRVAQSG